MTWTIKFTDAGPVLADPAGTAVVVARSGEELHRLLRLRDRLVAKEARDVQVMATFRPTDPAALTDVDVIGTDDEADYLAAIEAAGHRLLVFAADYRDAKAMELQPALAL